MQQNGKRICALLLALCMLVGVLPASVLAAEAETEIIGQKLFLGDDLSMHFYGNVSETHAADAVVNITVGGKTAAQYTVSTMTPEADGSYDFSVDLGAPQMTEDINLTLISGGAAVLEKTYSIQDYAHALLEGNYTSQTKAMVKELLNYGAKAQLYFGHKTGDLANAGYEMETEATISNEAASATVSGSVPGISYYGVTMLLKSKIALRYYFVITGDAADYTVTVDGEPYELKTKGSDYYIEVSGINPQEMDTAMEVKVSDGTKEMSLSYSPMHYITRMYNKDTSSAELKALLKAAVGYFEAAEAFVGVQEKRTGSLTMAYRYGTNNLIQVNTDLPSDTPCVNFTVGDNGCSIDQSGNTVQWVGWIGMENVDGTIVLTFHFNNAFTAGQTYVLPKGAVFGFTDESKYTLDKNYTFSFDGSGWTMEAKEPAIHLDYRYGTDNLIQYNTDLPATTPIVNFLAGDNGCNLIQSGDQSVGWIGMDNVDGTIILSFHFNGAFEVGQSYVLSADSIFGFTDGSKYALDADITLYWDGAAWTAEKPAEEEKTVSFAYRYGTNNLIQVNTDLPSDTPCVNFTTGDNGCSIDQSGNTVQWVGWIGMDNVDGTIVLTFHFNNAFTAGQSYVLPKGAVFGFTDGKQYVLDNNYTFSFDGASWSMDTQEDQLSLSYRYGAGNLIQFNTNLPATTPIGNFLAGDNGCNLAQSGDQQVGWIGMADAEGTIVLTFNFNAAFSVGQSYTLAKGSVFGFTDGSKYELYEDITLYYDGVAWVAEKPVQEMQMQYRWGAANVIQFNTDLPATTALKDFLATDNGCQLAQSGDQQVGYISMANAEGTIVLTFSFNNAFAYGQSYTLAAGSVFGFTDGTSYVLDADYTFYWNGSEWTTDVPADVLDESNFTGGKEFISFADLPVDSRDPNKINEYKGLGFNTSLMTEDHTGTKGPDECYTVSMETANAPSADDLNFQYRWGNANTLQVNTNLPSETPCVNFTAGDNGCIIDQSGNQYQQVGWIGMTNASGTIVLTFNFNNDFAVGQTYVLPKGAIFGFTDGSMYSLDKDYTFIWDGSNWHIATLNFTLSAGAAKYIQLKTNIPTGLSYGDFLLGDTSKGNLILETTDGAQSVAWFSYSELSGAVYLTFNFTGFNKPGTQYILKAGTSLNADGLTFTTDRDYILTVHNDYLTSLENLDNAGLDVWIRNHHNKADYFTNDLTATLLLYKDLIDGFYMVDEAFETNELLIAAGQENVSSDFNSMTVVRDWFNANFADKYYHSNHVPITSFDHYTDENGNTLTGDDPALCKQAYRKFLQAYKSLYNDQMTSASGASISFDNYPFLHAQGTYKYGILNLQSKFESGIQSTYLPNALIAAQVAGEDDFGLCIQTYEATDLTYDVKRDIVSAAEVSLQLYTGMALGADLFEYFAYNTNGDFNTIMNQDGSKRIYDLVAEGNKALAFHDVVNTFSWNGIVTSTGTVNSHNTVAFAYIADMVLADDTNGVLSSVISTDDAVIGCFTKDALNGYMVVNFNDPVAVTGNNTVTLNFANCTRARVYTLDNGALSSQLVDLTNGACTVTLVPGSGCFVIPA